MGQQAAGGRDEKAKERLTLNPERETPGTSETSETPETLKP